MYLYYIITHKMDQELLSYNKTEAFILRDEPRLF